MTTINTATNPNPPSFTCPSWCTETGDHGINLPVMDIPVHSREIGRVAGVRVVIQQSNGHEPAEVAAYASHDSFTAAQARKVAELLAHAADMLEAAAEVEAGPDV